MMSQAGSVLLGTFTVDINTHAAPGSTFHRLAELADCAFTLVEQYAGPETSSVPVDVESRFASITHSLGDVDLEPLPIRALLYQNTSTMHIQQVVINFQTMTAEYEGQPDLPISVEQIEHARDEIKPYLRNAWKRNREREEARRLQERLDWRDFCRRLRSKGVLSGEQLAGSDVLYMHKSCPLCAVQTFRCTTCHAILCLNRECVASEVIPFRSCSQHVSTASCLSCLESEAVNPSIGQCPACQEWFCQFEMTWCLGRPKDNSEWALSDVHGLLMANSAREHPTKPILCSSCAGGQEQPLCANENCWSRGGRCTRICKSCTSGGGLWCACEQCWICDDCKASPTVSYFKKCTRCRGVYCDFECDYIQFCSECNRTTPCEDCLEEDWSGFAGPDVSDGVALKDKCGTYACKGRICGECLEGARCAGCRKTFCSSCRRLQPWASDRRACPSCSRTRKQDEVRAESCTRG